MFVYLNGKMLSREDAHLIIGHLPSATGLIETMRWQKGQIYFWPQHVYRLQSACSRMGFPDVPNEIKVLEEIQELMLHNKHSDPCIVRLQYFYAKDQPNLWIEIKEFNHCDMDIDPKKVGLAQGITLTPNKYSDLKTTDRLPYDLARQQARENGWYDSLIMNCFGRISESAISNIFWIKNEIIFTPPLSEFCIQGIIRQFLLTTPLGFQVREAVLNLQSLIHADEVFLTNAVRGIQPIHFFEEYIFKTSLSESLRAAIPMFNNKG